MLREGYRIPFLSRPPLSPVPIPMPSYNPLSTRGVALEEVTLGLITKGAVELAPLPSPGFYSRLFVVWKTSGSWRPVIDLSTLNRFVDVSHFQMETIQSVLLSIRQGDWMASINLREATCRFRFIRSLVPSSALSPTVTSTNSKRCALAYPRLRRSSLWSWLLFPPFSTRWVSAYAGT